MTPNILTKTKSHWTFKKKALTHKLTQVIHQKDWHVIQCEGVSLGGLGSKMASSQLCDPCTIAEELIGYFGIHAFGHKHEIIAKQNNNSHI